MKITVNDWGMKEYFTTNAAGDRIYYKEDDNGFFFRIDKLQNHCYDNSACFKNRADAINFLKHGIINNPYTPDFTSIENARVWAWCCGC